ncbi:MAG: hypothetical protein MUP97_15390 [Acidimicrobiia bacterium]|nr:hypothetical protein [Acidimicrobiia bacterium]
MNTLVAGVTTVGLISLVVAIIAGVVALAVGSHILRHPGRATARRGHAHRFDGERAFVARGGAWIGDVRAAWPTAELAVDSTSARFRSRPGGLFDDITVDRGAVQAIVIRRGELGNGIAFHDAPDGRAPDSEDEVVFWPTDAGAVLEALRRRGWPVDAPA